MRQRIRTGRVAVVSVLLAGVALGATAGPATAEGVLLHAGGATAVPDSYLVVLKDVKGLNDREGSARVGTVSKGLTARSGGRVVRTFGAALHGFELAGDAATARRLAADPAVSYVEQNHRMRVSGTQTPTPSWGLDRVDQRSADLDDRYSYPTNAGNVTAYIIDTGVRITHHDFGGRARSGFDAIDGGTADDCYGHGTHVAGTVGGSTYGVAKAVKLVAVRVLDCSGNGTTAEVIAGIDWVTADHAAGVPAVANMSLGGDPDTALDDAVTGSIADGITYAVAAGNDETDACTMSPARTPAAITVAATGGLGGDGDERAAFSNYGACVDLFAPGVEIESAYNDTDTGTESFSGTSMASPHVAGAAAIVLALHPSFSPAQVRTLLVGNATEDVVEDAGDGSPNALLYIADLPPVNDFSVAVAPTGGAIDPGRSMTATVRTTTTTGAAQAVTLSLAGLPADVTATFTPAVVTSGGTSTLRLSAAPGASLGSYPLTVTGTGTGGSAPVRRRHAVFQLTVNGPPGCVVTAGTDRDIPDGDGSSLDSAIPIRGCAGHASALSTVQVHIVHPYPFELAVHLVAPSGTDHLLFNHDYTASTVDLTLTLDLSDEVAQGIWLLRVEDPYEVDSGYLDSWTIDLTSPPAHPGCTGSNPSDVFIPDPGSVTSAVAISGCNRRGTNASTVTVHIFHWYPSDLVVTLLAPDGTAYLLRDQEYESAEELDETYHVNLSAEPANGIWRLRVQDASPIADGFLDTWTLSL